MVPPPGMGPLGSGPVPPAPAGGGNRRNVLIIVGALVVGALVVGAAFVLRGDDEETGGGPSSTERSGTTGDDATTTTGADDPTTTEGGTAPVGEEFVSAGGLTFTRLPEPWHDWVEGRNRQLPELQPTAGQFVVVQETTPSGGGWIGNIVIGDLTPDIAYDGEADLPTAARELSTQLIETYYVEGSPTTIVNETAVTVDGHPGYFVHNEVSLSQEGLETTQEKVVVVVVDTGRARPGAFYASIPYNRADLNDGMDQAYRSLVVNE
jgi:hypothetical protein